MPDRNNSRSFGYQDNLLSIPTDPSILDDLSTAQGLIYRISPESYNELYLDLRDELKKRMWELVKLLTKRQQEVLELTMENLTQNEIAKILGINQTSVHKIIRGNLDYRGKHAQIESGETTAETYVPKRYGGALKKLTKLCQADEEIQEILLAIQEVQELMEL